METETEKIKKSITCTDDLLNKIADLVSHDMLTEDDQTSILRLVLQLVEGRRGEP